MRMTAPTRAIAVAALVAVMLVQTGCVVRREKLRDVAPVRTQSIERPVSLDGATKGTVIVMMSAGMLRLGAGAAQGHLVDGKFTYHPASMAPVLESATLGAGKQVVIRNDGDGDLSGLGVGLGRGTLRNEWDLKLAENVPTALTVSLGAGDGTIDLRDIDVERLTVNMGAGDATIDLSGARANDVHGTVQAGVGAVTIKVPRSVGVRVTGREDGVGDWTAPGFSRQGNFLVNDVYDSSPVKIELSVQRGIGGVRIEMVD